MIAIIVLTILSIIACVIIIIIAIVIVFLSVFRIIVATIITTIVDIVTPTIHVRYIYLHLPEKSTKWRQLYHTWMLWVIVIDRYS